jgi:Fe-S-cluster-containing dehydrogenase component
MGHSVSRRVVLQLVGAGAAAAGASACSRGPEELIVPYVHQPPEVTPSVPSRYATVTSLGGYAVGVLAESHEGRPTKLEGNPRHPASAGALGAWEQASLFDLYDPARARAVSRRGLPASWTDFASAVSASPSSGQQTHVVLEPTSAPHLIDLVRRVRARGDVAVHFHAPVSRDAAWAGAKLAFGRVLEPRYDFARADVVLSLDADFLSSPSFPHASTRAWAARRMVSAPGDAMSRLYVAEPRLTVTGMAADERLALQGRRVLALAVDLFAEIVALSAADVRTGSPSSPWAAAAARDLHGHRGASLVLAGDGQPPEVHVLAHALNERLGNVGATVTYGPSPVFEAGENSHGLDALVRAIDAGQVETLLVIGGDPLYTAPVDLELARRWAAIPVTAYVGLRDTVTGRASSWTGPESHWLEAWGDAVAFEGTAAIAQPLMRPLIDGRSAAQVLAAMMGQPHASSFDLVQAYWRAHTSGDFAAFWRQSLVQGVVPVTTVEGRSSSDVHVDSSAVARILAAPSRQAVPLEIAFYADSKVHDGRFGDNAWLQELPDPVTKLTWDNAALMSPPTAARLGVEDEHVVILEARHRAVRVAALIVPGMADDVVALALGYGQGVPDRPSYGTGTNAYALRESRALWLDEVTLHVTGETHALSLTQEHGSMEGRPIVLTRTLDEYRRDPDFARPRNEPSATLYALVPDAPHQWGMTIDLNACTGCSACVVACMAENNVPTVGKEGVRLGRAMHWLRLDRYYGGNPREPVAVVQPMLCQHCEKAPCEYVCPVNATVHSRDGLNEMVYNRCVGTRFCSNNCPYKVRRFNFFNYNAGKSETLALAMNPDVTVRARGVMEKCTYCVQRIREAEIVARREQRPIADGAIVTACQQTCPTAAISFGDIADPKTQVSRSRESARLYQVLHELGTVPRTRYLARIVNVNPALHRA